MINVRDQWEPAATLGIAFGAATALTCLLAATGGTRRLEADLVMYAALAALMSLTAQWWTALAVAAMLWLFYDGFLVGRHGVLTWHGTADLKRIAVIAAAAVGALVIRKAVGFTARILPQDLEALRRADQTQRSRLPGD